MLDKKIQDAIHRQRSAELCSSSLYYSMAAWFEARALKGFAHWMRVQALEEATHVQRFFSYVGERGGRVELMAIEAPPTEWDTPLAVFHEVYEHECKVTGLINSLMDLAVAESDHASVAFFQWFVSEQVEEESTADDVLQKLKLVDKTEGGLFMLDQEMDKRSFVLPPALVGVF